jgi:hypothetical protein
MSLILQLVFTSDNGTDLLDATSLPYSKGKASYTDGGIRVPLIIQWPKGIKNSEEVDNRISGYDIYPTVISIVDSTEEKSFKYSKSFKNLIVNKNSASTIYQSNLFWHFPHYHDSSVDGPSTTIIVGDYKLIQWHEGIYYPDLRGYSLFNLKEDIGETLDLSDQRKDIALNLKSRLLEIKVETKALNSVPRDENEWWEKSLYSLSLENNRNYYLSANESMIKVGLQDNIELYNLIKFKKTSNDSFEISFPFKDKVLQLKDEFKFEHVAWSLERDINGFYIKSNEHFLAVDINSRAVVLTLDNRNSLENSIFHFSQVSKEKIDKLLLLGGMLESEVQFVIMPNPFNSSGFKVSSNSNMDEYLIRDVTGRILVSKTFNAENHSGDLRLDSNGVYLLEIYYQKRIIASKKILYIN